MNTVVFLTNCYLEKLTLLTVEHTEHGLVSLYLDFLALLVLQTFLVIQSFVDL